MNNNITLPDIPVVVLDGENLLWLNPDGDMRHTPLDATGKILREPVILCNAPLVFDRLKVPTFPVFDILELFAFVRPGQFCVPTPNGVAQAVGLKNGTSATDQAMNIIQAAQILLNEISTVQDKEKEFCIAIAQAMAAAMPIWHWSPYILMALGVPMTDNLAPYLRERLNVWRQLPEWEDKPPRARPTQNAVTHKESREFLDRLVSDVIGQRIRQKAEPRPEQADYAGALTAAFQTPLDTGKPAWILAEAGTGVGKTLGYLAPALAWATKNDGQVWISTFTRHLQNQLQHDLRRVFGDEAGTQAVIRKGRENYLCLLNVEENIAQFQTGDLYARIGLGLMLRWIMATRDGDLTGGDLPGWLPVLVGTKPTLQMADRRGECIHQACLHYSRCFIERSIRSSRDATIVVANHALTLTQPFDIEDNDDEMKFLPSRLIFDEGHHLFDAADSYYMTALSGQETAELKRWMISDNPVKRLRRRGLAQRLANCVGDSHALMEHTFHIREAAHFLPEEGWLGRIHKAMPKTETEEFLFAVQQQILARNDMPNNPYDLECTLHPVSDALAEKSGDLVYCMTRLLQALQNLSYDIARLIEEDTQEAFAKRSLVSLIRSIQQRAIDPLRGWIDCLGSITKDTPETFVDWLGLRRIEGRDVDMGFYRAYRDPMQPFTEVMKRNTHGVVITSATLKPDQLDNDSSWTQAEQRTGGPYLRADNNTPLRLQIRSPFDYVQQTRVILVTDVDTHSPQELGGAFNTLFQASKGGALGLFTAIKRLQAVHPYLHKALRKKNIPLYAQHVDGLNTATLIDIFRAEEDACLLGTDALRDGVDVPGRALRLVVYDRIPWQRPNILHRARRAHFGNRAYDLFLTSMRLRQSFGRLIRSADDHGVFVLLESSLPSALYKAFPEGVAIEKMTLLQAKDAIQAFLNPVPSATVDALENAL